GARKPPSSAGPGDPASRTSGKSSSPSRERSERELRVRLEPLHADADEPQRSRPFVERAVEETACDVSDRLGVVDGNVERERARSNREVSVAKLRRDVARGLAVAAEMLGKARRHPAQLLVPAR